MLDTAQAYLRRLAAEQESRIELEGKYQAEKEEERLLRIILERNKQLELMEKEYRSILAKMPSELIEYYSFFDKDENAPLKVSIPLHDDFYVGYWDGELRYRIGEYDNRYSALPLPYVIQLAKSQYSAQNLGSKTETEPEPEPEPIEQFPPPPTAIDVAKSACEVGHYDKAIAFAMIEIAEQLREIDRSLCAN